MIAISWLMLFQKMAVKNRKKATDLFLSLFLLFPFNVLAETEYETKVVFDRVSLVIATENNTFPSSAMGHSFLKISGKEYEHAFSYYAVLDGAVSYLKTLFGNAQGAYVLSPYSKTAAEYLLLDNRSLWEFELDLNDKEKQILKKRIKEKKDKKDSYSFAFHNCNTALENLLSSVNNDFRYQRIKPFTTPVEYAKFLYQNKKIKQISFIRSPAQKNKKTNNILKSKPPSRLAIENGYLEFSPVYQDLRSISEAYDTEMETKMLAVRLSLKDKIRLNKLDLLSLFSLRHLSKYVRIGYEQGWLGEFGFGWGYNKNGFSVYVLAVSGGRESNAFVGIRSGVIQRFSNKAKAIISYENATDRNTFLAYLGFKIHESAEIYTQYRHHDKDENILGFALYF